MIVNVRPRTLRTRLAIAGLAALAAAGAISMPPQAHADGNISSGEGAYIRLYHSAVCDTIDEFPSEAGVLGVAQAIMQDGWAADSSIDIINGSVRLYCPRHWQLLVDIGNAARVNSSVWES